MPQSITASIVAIWSKYHVPGVARANAFGIGHMKSIFVIFAVKDPKALLAALREHYPADFLEVAPGQYLVAEVGTAQSLSNKLGISDGKSGAAIVTSVSGYYGRTSPSTWEWVKAKWGQEVNG